MTESVSTAEKNSSRKRKAQITVKIVVDSMGIYLIYKDRFKESTEVREIETIIEKEVNIIYWWQKLLMWIGGLAVTGICLHIVIRRFI